MAIFRSTLLRSLGAVALVVGVYILSIGPTARWVATSLRCSQTLDSFTRYDARLARYYTLYRPIHCVCSHDGSFLLYRAIWSYENLWIPWFSPPNRSLPVDSFVIWPQVFGLRSETTSSTAINVVPLLRQQGVQFASGGYAYYLPRTWTLVVHGTQEDIDLACLVGSDFGRRNDPLELSYTPAAK